VHVVGDAQLEPAVEDVEELVLALVQVRRRTAPGAVTFSTNVRLPPVLSPWP
jgi:hypothetical protein